MFKSRNFRLMGLMLALVAMLALVGCGGGGEAEGEGASVAGDWALGTISDGTNDYSVAEYAEMNGIDASMLEVLYTFNEDGTLTATMMGFEVEGTYTFDGTTLTMTIEGADAVSTYDADSDTLISEDAATGMSSILVRA